MRGRSKPGLPSRRHHATSTSMIFSLLNNSRPIWKRLIQKLSLLETGSTMQQVTLAGATPLGHTSLQSCTVCSLSSTKSMLLMTEMCASEFYELWLNNSLFKDVPSILLPIRLRNAKSLVMLWLQFSLGCLDFRYN
jgi:hypothetical protein